MPCRLAGLSRSRNRTPPLNYRHAFHAGNFADIVKHALLLAAIGRLTEVRARLTVFDTHAGAGLYDLRGEAARRSGEAQAGVARLMAEADPPATLRPLIEAVGACNRGGALSVYPGSPWLAMHALRRDDLYVGCELRPDDRDLLERHLPTRTDLPKRRLLLADGYAEAASHLAADPGRTLLLIDPPFERADDYARVAELIAARPDPARQPALVWTPLKDLETLDAFLGQLEAGRPSSLVCAQVRLRPLDDPMRLNGCAVLLVDAPDLIAEAREVCGWAAAQLGEAGAVGRVEWLAGNLSRDHPLSQSDAGESVERW